MNSRTEAGNGAAKEKSDPMLTHFIDEWSRGVLVGEQMTSLMDHEFKAALSRAFSGMSPIEISLAYLDWLSHLAISPGK